MKTRQFFSNIAVGGYCLSVVNNYGLSSSKLIAYGVIKNVTKRVDVGTPEKPRYVEVGEYEFLGFDNKPVKKEEAAA